MKLNNWEFKYTSLTFIGNYLKLNKMTLAYKIVSSSDYQTIYYLVAILNLKWIWTIRVNDSNDKTYLNRICKMEVFYNKYKY